MRSATGLRCLMAAAMLVGATCPAMGQSYEWRPGDGLPGTNAVVNCMLNWDPDGAGPQPELFVMGGSFSIAGQTLVSGIAAWDGTRWHPLGGGIGGIVYDMVVYNGDLIAAGDFTSAGGNSAYHVARWDGSSWHPLGAGMMNGNGYVRALAVYNGDLYAAGTFSMAGLVYSRYISRWDGTTWQPVGAGNGGGMTNGSTAGSLYALTVYDGKLIAGGTFTAAGQVPCSNIAAWDGTTWQPIGGGTNSTVTSLGLYDGQLIAGGGFTTAGGVAAKGLASWNGSTWQSIGGSITNGSYVSCMTVYNGELIVGGNFYAMGNVATRYVASWDGAHWQPVGNWTAGTNFYVDTLGVYNGELYAGGNFTNIGSLPCNYVGRWDGTAWKTLTTGMNSAVQALAVHDGQLVAGGTFTSAAGVGPCSYIARTTGSGWQPLGSGMNNAVYALTIYNGDLIAGGTFTTAGGVACNRIARWDGTAWYPLGSGVNNTVTALTVWNGMLIAGGTFTSAGGVAASRIAAWNGTAWQPLGSGVNNTVYALTAYNGELIAGGYFTTAGGTPASCIARWNGSTWQPLGTGTNGSVLALIEFDGQLIAGGDFNSAGGVPSCWSVARWNGSNWATMDQTNGSVEDFAVYNGELYCAGPFGAAGQVAARTVARWNGTVWVPMSGGLNGSTSYALEVYNGELVVGGTFTATYDGKVSSYWARWGPVMPTFLTQPAAQSVLLGEPASFTVKAIGAGTIGYQWYKDGQPIDGATSATFTIPAVAAADDGLYTCVATNDAGSTASDAVRLTVLLPAAIETQPANQAVVAGASATFHVAAIGTPTLQYQWRRAGVALVDDERISGATTDTLTINNVQPTDADTYDVVVTNAYGTATSSAATLTILLPPAIVTQPVGTSIVAGQPITLTVAASGSGTLSYQWRKDGIALADDGRILGSTTATLTINPSATTDAGSYDVVVTSEYGTVTSQAAVVQISAPITIIRQPACLPVNIGDPVVIFVQATGEGTLSYQWRKDGVNLTDGGSISGATTNALAIDPVSLADAGSYDVVISTAGSSVTSDAATLSIVNAQETPAGSQVSLTLVDPNTGYACATVTFQNVTSPGLTAVTTVAPSETQGPPSGFKFGAPPTLYQLETTAVFTGPIEVCFDYGNIGFLKELQLKLFHFDNGGWVNVTSGLNILTNRICGQVEHFSLFGVFEEEEVNTAPAVTITGPQTGHVQAVHTNVTLTATITDPDVGDSHTAVWTLHDEYWGDIVIPGTVTGNTVQNVVQLANAGIYHISLTVTDAAGLSDTATIVNDDPAMNAFVVIYDPTDGFVTGGGWIISPAGALQWAPDGVPLQAEGKATFGFNSKYHKGASVPTGNTEFQFKAGNFHFKSTACEWLVVAGTKAMYKGTGQIQGLSGDCGFMLTGVDSSSGDRFRIKIWHKATGHVIYDNKRGLDDSAEPTLLGGGSIQIHK